MLRKLTWQGYTNDDRNEVIEKIKDAISDCDGSIMNFNMFSDLAISLSIEIEEYNIIKLNKVLSTFLKISDYDHKGVNQKSKKDWLILMNISFGQGKGELTKDIPVVPG